MGKHAYPRLVRTIIPDDSIFRFAARTVREGTKDGLRVTVPAPIARGLLHLGVAVGEVAVRVNSGPAFTGRMRRASSKQAVLALPRELRGQVAAGELIALEVAPRLAAADAASGEQGSSDPQLPGAVPSA